MSFYCSKCKKKKKKKKEVENVNPNVQEFQKLAMVKQWKTMILSKCAIFDSKKSRFIKKQEAKEILNKIPFLVDILHWMQFHWITMKWTK